MITSLELQNFKSFKLGQIDLRPLTLLVGLNGMGKSSLIQSLLLLRQSFLTGDLQAGRLALDGDLVSVGSASDILFEDADDDYVRFALEFSGRDSDHRISFSWLCDTESGEVAVSHWAEGPGRGIDEAVAGELSLFSSNFCYVQAERIGPRKITDLSAARARAGDIGTRGEFVNHVLLAHGDKVLDEGDPRLHPIAASRRLIDQVNAWLHEISPGSYIDIEAIKSADSAVAGFKFDRQGDVQTRTFRATNVGFGLTYSLPVIVGLLLGRPGGILLIENPEAHVHPRGQTMLGRLASRACRLGMQILAETHSDHFMDGVRIEVRIGNVAPDMCGFVYFTRSDGMTQTQQPVLEPDGRLSFWPDGFFDQKEQNLATIISGVEVGPGA